MGINKMLVESITGMIMAGDTEKAKREIEADKEYSKITGKARQLNELQIRDLLEAITITEIESGIF